MHDKNLRIMKDTTYFMRYASKIISAKDRSNVFSLFLSSVFSIDCLTLAGVVELLFEILFPQADISHSPNIYAIVLEIQW